MRDAIRQHEPSTANTGSSTVTATFSHAAARCARCDAKKRDRDHHATKKSNPIVWAAAIAVTTTGLTDLN